MKDAPPPSLSLSVSLPSAGDSERLAGRQRGPSHPIPSPPLKAVQGRGCESTWSGRGLQARVQRLIESVAVAKEKVSHWTVEKRLLSLACL